MPGAADADHVQAPLGEARHSASSRSVVAIRSAASGRASRRAASDIAASRDRLGEEAASPRSRAGPRSAPRPRPRSPPSRRSGPRSGSGGRRSRSGRVRAPRAFPRRRSRRPSRPRARRRCRPRRGAARAPTSTPARGSAAPLGPEYCANSRSPVMWTTVNPGSGSAHAAAADRLIVVEPRLPPNTSTTGRSAGQVELAPALLGAPLEHGPRDRPAGDLVAGRVLPGDREREEDAARERRAQAVGQAEVGVDLEQRRGDAQHAGGGEHRPGDVAPAAEDDVGAHIAQDADAPRRRQTGQPEPADERRRWASAGGLRRDRCGARTRRRARAAPRSGRPCRRTRPMRL